MRKCQGCDSERIMVIQGHCDSFTAEIGEHYYKDYVPEGIGVVAGADIFFSYCLNCGQIQRKFPLPVSKLENNQ